MPRLLALIMSLLALAALGIASPAQADSLVKMEMLPSLEAYPAGSSHPVAFRITIKPGFHINAADPTSPEIIPTQLKLTPPAGLTIKDPRFPAPQMHKLSFLPKPVPVYGGAVLVKAMLQVAAGAAPGPRQIKALLSYQGCNDQMCLMPEQVAAVFTVNVAPAGAAGKPLNQEAFKGK